MEVRKPSHYVEVKSRCDGQNSQSACYSIQNFIVYLFLASDFWLRLLIDGRTELFGFSENIEPLIGQVQKKFTTQT